MVLALVACNGSEPVATSGSFTALTYNVHGLPDAVTNTERPTAERMVRIAPLLRDYDVIGLQEDFAQDNHAALVAEADHAVQHWFGDVLPDRVYPSGLAVLSRVESAEYAEDYYAQCYGVVDGASDCLASKGFQVLTLSLGGALLDVYNTHHEAGGGAEDDAARASQVDQILASLPDDRAVLFLGDTNLHWSDPEDAVQLTRYADAGLVDACDLAGCAEPDHIDRFLLRDGGGLALDVTTWSREEHFVDEDGADLSDHPAIAVAVGWAR